ncbi:hypothetical protein Nepgr_033146 [Nepenthes gracilis]|uniref:Uncharacterized protein n=1 Tax=Nepenthes gracilis TaxID=150966 RepID=A0AAD3Y6P1_NEPGR|nr:hypothetical protein Nepgr_033146 [Nepenthes gracilis]
MKVVRPMNLDAKVQDEPVMIMDEVPHKKSLYFEFQKIMSRAANFAKEFTNDYVEKEKLLKAEEHLLKIGERV